MITDERVHRLLAGLIGKPRHSRKAEDTRD
jgi:hypothetical protein